MSSNASEHSARLASLGDHNTLRRTAVLLAVLGVLLIMGFYTVTNPENLHNHALLEGADWVSYALCHRITDRSFTIAGRQFPLCARCTGMYLGVALTFVVLALAGRLRHAQLPALPLLLALLGFIGIMGLDGINSYSHFFPNAPHLYEPQNWLRLLTGMGTGLAMGIIILPALAQTLWRTPHFRPVLANGRELLLLIAVALFVAALVLSNQPALLYVLALVSGAGLLLIVTAVNTVIVLIALRKDGRARTWQQTAVPLIGGFMLAVLELSAISLVRFTLTGTMTGLPGL